MNPGPQYTGGQFFMPPPHFQNLPSFQNPLSFPSHPYSIQQPIVPAEQLSSSGPICHSTSQERNPQLYPYPHYAEPGLSAHYAPGGQSSLLGSLERIPQQVLQTTVWDSSVSAAHWQKSCPANSPSGMHEFIVSELWLTGPKAQQINSPQWL